MELLRTALALGALWVFVCWLYRDYRDDVLKQHLFDLRDELFDLAAGGKLGFDEPAYGMLRTAINGFLFTAEKISFTSLVLFGIAGASGDVQEADRAYRARWKAALDALNAENRAAVEDLRQRVNFRLVDHVFFTSPLLWMTVVPLIVCLAVALMGGAVRKSIHLWIVRFTRIEDFDLVGETVAEGREPVVA